MSDYTGGPCGSHRRLDFEELVKAVDSFFQGYTPGVITGTGGALGGPKDDKPERRYFTQRCRECTLMRALTDNGMCEECRGRLDSYAGAK